MSLKTRDFVDKSLTVAKQNLDSMPRGLDLDEALRNLALRDALWELEQSLQQLLELVAPPVRRRAAMPMRRP